MGYTLKIGELETATTDDGLESIVLNDAKDEHHENAPAFGDPTDHTNSRWPSYSGWADVCRLTGLSEFFFNKGTGLIRQHPGCFPLKKEHKEIIDKAYDEFYKKYPNAKPGYSPRVDDIKVFEDNEWPEENAIAVRLEWLKYWVDWALINCKQPVFVNS